MLWSLAACASGQSVPTASGGRTAQDTTANAAGNGGQALPGGNGGQALPGGNGGQALPGTSLGCALPSTPGQASCPVVVNTNVPAVLNPNLAASLIAGLHPMDLQTAYAMPWQNSGGTVAIVDAHDDPYIEADLAVYRNAFGLPACTSQSGCFKKVNQAGVAGAFPSPDQGWAEEISLDVDMVSAICPHCSIVLVEANSPSVDDLGTAVDTAAHYSPVAISNSYYANEWAAEATEDVHYNHPGIAITVSAGDEPNPYYPAASQYVTSVGGTTLSSSGETAWAYGGRGCSAYIVKPGWQRDNGCSGMRSTVDVAAVADQQTGVSMYDSSAGGWLVAGGTSIGAPLLAAAYALSGRPAGPSFSYVNAAAFHDIPPVGYDLATGLGSPNGVAGL